MICPICKTENNEPIPWPDGLCQDCWEAQCDKSWWLAMRGEKWLKEEQQQTRNKPMKQCKHPECTRDRFSNDPRARYCEAHRRPACIAETERMKIQLNYWAKAISTTKQPVIREYDPRLTAKPKTPLDFINLDPRTEGLSPNNRMLVNSFKQSNRVCLMV